MTITLTPANVREALNAAMEERGEDFVYPEEWKREDAGVPGCVYALEDGTPACIVGVVLAKLGVDLAPLKEHNMGALALLREEHYTPAIELREKLGINMPDQATAEALVLAQVDQDGGATWGKARDAAFSILDSASKGGAE